MRKYLTIFLLVFIAGVLYFTVLKITEDESIYNPTYIFHTAPFIKQCFNETGINNIVEAITINYRSMDSLGGIVILLTSIISISSLLRSSFKSIVKTDLLLFEDVILKTIVELLTPLCLLFTFYIFYNSNSTPGGGFQSGLMLSAIMIFMCFTFGTEVFEKKVLLKVRVLIIFLAFITIIFIGSISVIFGYNFFSYNFSGVLNKFWADNIREMIYKTYNFSVLLLVGMVITSLFYIMAGEDV